MTRWLAKLAAAPDRARPDHRLVFARFAERLAARLPRPGVPRLREV